MAAQSVPGCACSPFHLRNVPARSTFVVVVINTALDELLHLIDGVERVNDHRNPLLNDRQVYHFGYAVPSISPTLLVYILQGEPVLMLVESVPQREEAHDHRHNTTAYLIYYVLYV